MSGQSENEQFSQELRKKYGLRVPVEVITSVYSSKPKLRVLLSRTSFRQEAVHTPERAQRERRNFLRNLMGLAVIAVPLLVWMKIASTPQPQAPSYVSNPSAAGGKLLANASSIPAGQSITLDDPSFGPFLLIHLSSGQFVAYSAICTHAGCQVQFDPGTRQIACPCHGAVFDPNNSAAVIAGPAPSPLQRIPITYDSQTGNIYLQ
jgi:Rieske Fe-S protein